MSTFFAFPGHSGFAVGWRRRPFIQQALLLQRTPEIIRDRRGNPLQAVFQLRYRAGAGNNRGHRRVSQDKLQRGRWQTDVIIAADVFNFADFLQNRRAGRAAEYSRRAGVGAVIHHAGLSGRGSHWTVAASS